MNNQKKASPIDEVSKEEEYERDLMELPIDEWMSKMNEIENKFIDQNEQVVSKEEERERDVMELSVHVEEWMSKMTQEERKFIKPYIEDLYLFILNDTD
jgi:HSP90 family molecular chaperone